MTLKLNLNQSIEWQKGFGEGLKANKEDYLELLKENESLKNEINRLRGELMKR